MNVALCISGHLRTIEKCYSSHYDNILKNINPDVFIHSWSFIESETNSWHKLHMKNKKIDANIIKFLEEKYNPKLLKIEDQINFKLLGNQFGTNISSNGQKNMTYSAKQSFLLQKDYSIANNIKYDFIIKIRPDLFIKKDFLKSSLDFEKKLILFGNKRKKTIYKNKNIGYSALDCLYILNCNNLKENPFFIYDNFNEFYLRKNYINSPFLDYIIEKNIDFEICNNNLYGNSWIIKRN